MKRVIWFIIGLHILSGCNKHEENTWIPGKIITQVNYRGAYDNSLMKNFSSKATNSNDLYTGFGYYITSVTPKVFKAKFICIRYVDELNAYNQMELIDNNLPDKDPLKYADFTNSSSVTLFPTLNGNLVNEGASFDSRVLFKYFYFRIQYFYQEIQLPEQYASIDALDQFSYANSYDDDENNQTYSSLANNILKARYRMFLAPKFGHMQRGVDAFVFGGTDSSYVINLFTDLHDFPNNLPYDGDYIVRSKNYTPITFTPSESSDKNTLINATVSFDYNNLIQIYAGADNIPYTKDDVFLYEPYFYDRLMVNVIIE
jgi:hypothetical protein